MYDRHFIGFPAAQTFYVNRILDSEFDAASGIHTLTLAHVRPGLASISLQHTPSSDHGGYVLKALTARRCFAGMSKRANVEFEIFGDGEQSRVVTPRRSANQFRTGGEDVFVLPYMPELGAIKGVRVRLDKGSWRPQRLIIHEQDPENPAVIEFEGQKVKAKNPPTELRAVDKNRVLMDQITPAQRLMPIDSKAASTVSRQSFRPSGFYEY